VFDLENTIYCMLRQTAILATLPGPLAHHTARRGIH
jgi:hypothetical protein